MAVVQDKLNIFGTPLFDTTLVGFHEITHKPYGLPAYKPSDKIHIDINYHDLVLDISDSYVYIEGTFKDKDQTKPCHLTNNALAFLFNEIRYESGGETIAVVRNPGITSALKILVSNNPNRSILETSWGLHSGEQAILDKTSHTFSGKLPLKHVMGFAIDYRKALVNLKHELILEIAQSFKHCYGGAGEADLVITKIEWKIKHMKLNDETKLRLFSRISSEPIIQMAYRSWDLYELPSLRQTKNDVWSVKTTTSLERPRYILIAFQNDTSTSASQMVPLKFQHANINNIRIYLNSEVFPHERWNLDFTKNLYTPAYDAYKSFQASYYVRPDYACNPLMNYNEFKKQPVFVFDCSHQSEAVNLSTVDLRIEFEASENFSSSTSVFMVVIHDTLVQYNPLTGNVQKQQQQQ